MDNQGKLLQESKLFLHTMIFGYLTSDYCIIIEKSFVILVYNFYSIFNFQDVEKLGKKSKEITTCTCTGLLHMSLRGPLY